MHEINFWKKPFEIAFVCVNLWLRKKCPYSELFWSAFSRIGLNTESVFSLNARKCGKNADQNNSEYGHLLRNLLLPSKPWKHKFISPHQISESIFENYASPSLKKLTTASSSVSNQMARFNKSEKKKKKKKKTINEISTETHFWHVCVYFHGNLFSLFIQPWEST